MKIIGFDLEQNLKSFKAPNPKFFKLNKELVAKTTNPNFPSSCRNWHTLVNCDDPVKLAQQEVRAQLPDTVLRSNRSKPCFPEQTLARIKAQDQIKGDHLIRMLAGEQTSLQQHNPEDFAKLISYLKESKKHCAD